jgi:hypothetical protein
MHARTYHHVPWVLACALLAPLGACEQPAPKCNVAHGPFWAQYTLVSGEGDCAMLTGEELDVHSYFARRSASDPRPDYDKVSIAIQPLTITAALANAAGLEEPESSDRAYAIGRFDTTSPDADGFCQANTLSVARLRLPAVPEHPVDMCSVAPEAPEYDLGYEFGNVRVYYTPSAIGTQFAADLTYTQAGCVAKYRVQAVYPMVSCAAPRPAEEPVEDAAVGDAAAGDDDAGVEFDAGAGAGADAGEPCPPPEPPPGPADPDDSLCQSAGINSDFAVVCDPASLMCVLENKPPSLK